MEHSERYLSFKAAAKELGLAYHQIQRAAKKGHFPSYKLFGKRPLVRLSEVVAAITASQQGGCDE